MVTHRQGHVVHQLCETDLRLDHPELSQVPRSVGVLQNKHTYIHTYIRTYIQYIHANRSCWTYASTLLYTYTY